MKKLRKFLTVLLTFSLVFSLFNFTVAAAGSDPTVVFNASSNTFRFENVDVYEHTDSGAHEHPENVDLFKNMKGLMPGDVITEHIRLKVENLTTNKVNLYLRAENPNEDFAKLAGNGDVLLWVQYDDVIYNSTLDEDGIQLGQFSLAKDEAEINVILEIDKLAGNELQGLIAEIDWVFTAEVISNSGGGGGGGEIPVIPPVDPPIDPPVDPPIDLPDEEPPLSELPDEEPPLAELPDEDTPLAELPATGETMLWLVMAALSGAGLVLLMMTGKKEKKENA